MDKIKSGFVAIIGRPNTGKSTLMNALLGERLSIITKKPQTTRKRILGILTKENYQVIFLDTPGILEPAYLLQKKLLSFVEQSVKDADILLFMVDIAADHEGRFTFEDTNVQKILPIRNIKKLLLINKIDLSNEETVKKFTQRIEKEEIFDRIIPISAQEKFNLDKVLGSIFEFLPEHPKYYPDDQLTDGSERFFVSEIIREKIFDYYRDEIPYSSEVVIEDFKEREKHKDFISAVIIIEKESQKPIIIGRKGDALKKVGLLAREAIEEFLGRPVYLELRVKVRNKWRSNPRLLKNFGYISSDEK